MEMDAALVFTPTSMRSAGDRVTTAIPVKVAEALSKIDSVCFPLYFGEPPR